MRIFYKLMRLLPSLMFCLRYLPLGQAIKVPVCVGKNVKCKGLKKGQIEFLKDVKCYQMLIGGGGSPGLQSFPYTTICMSEGSKLFFHGRAIISNGTTLRCDTNSIIEIGDNFYCNNNCYIRSTNRIRFGDNCLLGWNVQISTTSGHVIKRKNKLKTEMDSIDIGKHVWIAKDVTLSKGVEIAEDSVVAQNSVVVSKFSKPNSLIAGIPAKIIAHDIEWHA